jgi:hypothetical protein
VGWDIMECFGHERSPTHENFDPDMRYGFCFF